MHRECNKAINREKSETFCLRCNKIKIQAHVAQCQYTEYKEIFITELETKLNKINKKRSNNKSMNEISFDYLTARIKEDKL